MLILTHAIFSIKNIYYAFSLSHLQNMTISIHDINIFKFLFCHSAFASGHSFSLRSTFSYGFISAKYFVMTKRIPILIMDLILQSIILHILHITSSLILFCYNILLDYK